MQNKINPRAGIKHMLASNKVQVRNSPYLDKWTERVLALIHVKEWALDNIGSVRWMLKTTFLKWTAQILEYVSLLMMMTNENSFWFKGLLGNWQKFTNRVIKKVHFWLV